ncbi:hypothetical protein GGS23DRAFT_576794 [Durotheca rogersii]|uniref:uncharacterized protein n=1 Tax=Durotheca rogersii TaxID=419775 RepID=UPI00221E606C|nr:uncharacterized protein GGS23DRAFT_576794 [Durotheca rogersii]KAI5861433.1 hypothetical protein GGS23DRAFT_576794 [Durotheca rogersii]
MSGDIPHSFPSMALTRKGPQEEGETSAEASREKEFERYLQIISGLSDILSPDGRLKKIVPRPRPYPNTENRKRSFFLERIIPRSEPTHLNTALQTLNSQDDEPAIDNRLTTASATNDDDDDETQAKEHREENTPVSTIPRYQPPGLRSRQNLDISATDSLSKPSSSSSSSSKPSDKPFNPLAAEWRSKSLEPSTSSSSQLGDNATERRPPRFPRGMSRRYMGDPTSAENRGDRVSASRNCSLHITNLPPSCTVADLLGSIRGIGKVYACNIRAPTAAYPTAAAKLVLWDRAATEALIREAAAGHLVVGGYAPSVHMNDHRVAPQPVSYAVPGLSRVLRVRGPPEIVERGRLEALFKRSFRYELEGVTSSSGGGGGGGDIAEVEFRFSSYRCQASNAFKFILQASRNQRIPGFEFTPHEQAL